MAAHTSVLDESNIFAVAIGSLHGDLKSEEEHGVIGDPLTKTTSCSCGIFNWMGILCRHGWKPNFDSRICLTKFTLWHIK
jgi:hypothetical protein